MKKKEFIQLHALLSQLRDHCENENIVPSEPFEQYDTDAVGPALIHKSKDDHKRAVLLIGRAFDNAPGPVPEKPLVV